MILITGGAGQGKLAYAQEILHLTDIADGADCPFSEFKTAQAVTNYHLLVRRLGKEAVSFTETLCRENPQAVILLDEVGCGIVPMEKEERVWRETVGRCGCILAAHAQTVIRMTCGIPAVIKGELS